MMKKARKPAARLGFSFDGMEVGILTPGPPSRNGIFEYMPYRGPGHLAMQDALKTKGLALCQCETPWEDVVFAVHSCPAYGKLSIRLEPPKSE